MAKKKTRYPNRKKELFRSTIILVILAALLAGGIFAAYWLDTRSKSYIITYNDRKIPFDEYLYYLYSHSQDEASEIYDNAMNSLKSNLLIFDAARDLGVTMTEEEIGEASLNAQVLNNYFESAGQKKLNISNERWIQIFGEDALVKRLIDELGKDCVIDEEEFVKLFEEYYETGSQDYTEVLMKYVLAETEEAAAEAREKLLSGEDIDEVIKEFSVAYTEGQEINAIDLRELGFDTEQVDQLTALGAGGISEVIVLEDNNNFAVFKIESVTIPTKEELEVTSRENYLWSQKVTVFNEEFSKWAEAATFKTNVKAYNTLIQ